VFVDDPVKKQGLADIYRAALSDFVNRPRTDAPEDSIDRSDAASKRMTESVMHLAAHIHEVPVLCVPIVAGRTDGFGEGAQADRTDVFWQASRWGSVVPALWSFMLALRSRGLGSAWTTLTLVREREVAELLGIPYEKWMQVGLFPVAYTKGTDFRITPRRPAAEVTAWNGYALED
jgi:nitroreductase